MKPLSRLKAAARDKYKRVLSAFFPAMYDHAETRRDIQKLTRELERNRFDNFLYHSPDLQKIYRDVFAHFPLFSVIDTPKKRFGRNLDGGYVMLDDLAGIDAAYSFGISDDVTWDLAIAQLGIPVYQFDESVSHSPVPHSLFIFTRSHIASERSDSNSLESIAGISNRFHHAGKKLIFKMDIEGAEWEILDAIDENLLAQFDQIVCELHHLSRLSGHPFRVRVLRVLAKLNARHRLIHVHANNSAPVYRFPDFTFPDCLEVTYVLAQGRRFEPCAETFPGPLDYPCDPHAPEAHLGNFRF
jgi:hypothetical protein